MSLDDFIQEHYEELVRYARKWNVNANDLVHHVYIKAKDAGFVYINKQMTDWYLKSAIKNAAMRSSFKNQYQTSDTEVPDIADVADNTKVLNREKIDLALRQLSWFDRQVFTLYLEGQNMKRLSEESGIPNSTIYASLKRTRTILKQNIE